jgi:deoxyribose-phosphate aldolase
MTPAKFIDHTNIKKNATEEDIKTSCIEAKKYSFRGLCVNPQWTKLARKELKDTAVKIAILIDPPMGLSTHENRMEAVKRVKEEGADEIDVVMNVVDLKYERYSEVLQDLKEICQVLPTKVIIGSGYLTDKEIHRASELVREAGAFCVKTATERDPLDRLEMKEKAKHLKIMKEAAKGLKIKAAGGIRSFADFITMLENGADIIGTSSGVEIVEEFNKIFQ